MRVDPAFVRPREPVRSSATRRCARRVLGWDAAIRFEAMIGEMVQLDLAELAATEGT